MSKFIIAGIILLFVGIAQNLFPPMASGPIMAQRTIARRRIQCCDPPKTKEVYPESYGAVGDGVTDDSTAIQSAIDFINNTDGGHTLRFTELYAIANPILFTGKNYRVMGTGWETGILWTGSQANNGSENWGW